MDNRITIVGGIPQPIGGVTTFIKRLVDKYPDSVYKVVDLYPATQKQEISVEHQVVPNGSLIWLFFLMLFSVKGTIYFNFSGARGLLILALLPKLKGSRWGLTLHNGELDQRISRNILVSYLLKHGLRKCNLLGVVSEKQKAFYLRLGVDPNKIVMISTFVPRDWSIVSAPSEMVLPEFVAWLKEGCRVFVASGYPTRIYQHQEILNSFIELRNAGHCSMRLALFLYGSDSDGLLSSLYAKVAETGLAKIYWSVDEDEFLAALKSCAGYIRMNTVDSFGIAVADAVTAGKPVIASDVCDRFIGAEVIAANDFEGVKMFVRRVVEDYSEKPQSVDANNMALMDFIDKIRKLH